MREGDGVRVAETASQVYTATHLQVTEASGSRHLLLSCEHSASWRARNCVTCMRYGLDQHVARNEADRAAQDMEQAVIETAARVEETRAAQEREVAATESAVSVEENRAEPPGGPSGSPDPTRMTRFDSPAAVALLNWEPS